jgi:prepilin-type N-terminal cleavage/methylation domain-containing protein
MKRLKVLRRGGGEEGFTLVELMVVMIILTAILTALTMLFVSGVRSELDSNRRYQAQHEARTALERLRREGHCASAITATSGVPTSTITITLPAACPGSATSVVYTASTSASGGYKLERAGVLVADYLTQSNVFTYYAPSAASLGRLHVDFTVDVHPSGGSTSWHLVDDIVLRNTVRA